MQVERWIEGDRAERIGSTGALDRRQVAQAAAKHAAWLLIALLTGGAWIMYFNDAPTVVADSSPAAPASPSTSSSVLFTATTYLLAGFAREQVCTYMCPWPRIQGALSTPTRWRSPTRLARRAARQVPQGRELRRARRLHRLQAVRRGLPHRHRHPRRLPARMHRLRPVHRCLRRGHGQDRPAARLIAYDSERNQICARPASRGPPARAAAHAPLCGRAGGVGRRHAGPAGVARHSTSTSCPTATRCSSRCPTAASATATPSG